MKYIIIFWVIIILLPLINADTTFFDNPDDFFIMSDSTATSPTGEVIEGTTGGTTGGGSCLYKWNYTNWGECLPSGIQIRNCINVGTCPDTYNSPEIEQDCTYTPSLEVEEEEKINGKEIINNKIFIYFIISLVILFIIFYLKKNYFKKLIKKYSKINLKRK